MHKIRNTFTVLVMVLGIIMSMTGTAFAGFHGASWHDVNSPGSYCGTSFETIRNTLSTEWQESTGAVTVDNSNPCTSGMGNPVTLPANYLKVTVTLRCIRYEQNQFDAWSQTTYNTTNTSGVAYTIPAGAWCGTAEALGYPKAKTTITAGYYVYPTGWVYFTHASAWEVMS